MLIIEHCLAPQLIYMRWDPPYGWYLGTIERKFDSSTPRLLKMYNFRIKWDNHKLILDNYLGGASAPYRAWVLLKKVPI